MEDQDKSGLNEVMETLDHLEGVLIDYENSLKAGEEDTAGIHIIFRYAHNLKGSLGMLNLEYSSALIHSLESYFDLLRSGKTESSQEALDLSLKAIDLIRYSLHQEKEAETELQSLTEGFESLIQFSERMKKKKGNSSLSQESLLLLKEAAGRGETIFLVEKLINTDISREAYETLPIYNSIQEIGSIISREPDFEEIPKNRDQTTVKILFTTPKSEEDLFFVIFDPLKQIDPKEFLDKLTEKKSTKDKDKKNLHILIVEDDFVTRHLEYSILSKYGICAIAVNGREAIAAFQRALESGNRYNLIVLDIMIPELNGIQVLENLRIMEADWGIEGLDASKVIIISSLSDFDTISRSFNRQSDAYIIKPFTQEKAEKEMKRLGLIP